MSNLEVEISRSSINGHYDSLWINIRDGDDYDEAGIGACYDVDEPEDQAVDRTFDLIVEHHYSQYLTGINVEQLRLKVVEGFRQLRENDLSGNSEESMEIILEPKDTANEASEESEISQSELQQKLAIVEKDSKVMKYFEDNKCSVCLSSYKEVLDNNRQIVIPPCGHPLCCECADNILVSVKKECPRCRGNITADSFNLMKFNADLEMKTGDQKVFL